MRRAIATLFAVPTGASGSSDRVTKRCSLVIVLGLVGAMSAAVSPCLAAGEIRAPRDSPILLHGRLQSLSEPSPPRPLTAQPRPTAPPLASTLPAPLGIDPGYRPLWVPDTYLWNGFGTIRIPGHWVW